MTNRNESMPEEFFEAFLVCGLWSSNDYADEAGGEPLDRNYDESDIAPDCLTKLRRDCESFWGSNSEAMSELDAAQCGHDFWLTRNGHGAGFWDRGLGELGERLSEACKAYRGVDLYVGDDGLIHC